MGVSAGVPDDSQDAIEMMEFLAEVLADEPDGSLRAVLHAFTGDQRPGSARCVADGDPQRGEGGVPRVTKKRESPSGLSLFLPTCSEVGG
jgi:hypothetical protein